MGVLEPVVEEFDGEIPATPPGIHALDDVQDGDSDDDLFAESVDQGKSSVFGFNHELSFKNILPVLPSKGVFDDILRERGMKNIFEVQTPTLKKDKYCSGCVEGVKKDLLKLASIVDNYKNERDAAREENTNLKKELEEVKKLLKQKEESEKGDVKVSITNHGERSVDVLLRKKNFENARSTFSNLESFQSNLPDHTKRYGVQSFSISLAKENIRPIPDTPPNHYKTFEPRSKKSVAELRREFFAEFQSEQKTFTSRNYLEIKPEEKKTTVRSELTIRVKPKQRISEIISKLTSKISGSKVIPDAPQLTMFQRFEKTRVVYQSDLEKKTFAF